MSDSEIQPDQPRLDAVQCPHCEQVTMPNLLADRSLVCSCSAERALPPDLLGAAQGKIRGSTAPPPVDAGSVAETRGPFEAAPGMPPAEHTVGKPRLPKDDGQFGRDVATEAFKPLAEPPDGGRR